VPTLLRERAKCGVELVGTNFTVLGREKITAVDTQKLFETEWVHVFTVKSDKITRWRGFFNTAARYDS
jgi:hypothetical protein